MVWIKRLLSLQMWFGALTQSGCTVEFDCAVHTDEDLRVLSASEECPDATIVETELETLDSLVGSREARSLTISRNFSLQSVDGATGAKNIIMQGNSLLASVDVTVKESFTSDFGVVDSASITIDGDAGKVHFRPTPSVLNLSCSEACKIQLSLGDVDGISASISNDNAVGIDLLINGTLDLEASLDPFESATNIYFFGEQDLDTIRLYQDRLRSRGGTGIVWLCGELETISTCQPVE